MQTKSLLQKIFILSFSILSTLSLKAQVPNFTLTDINGVEHDLYEDYLDQGKTVLISIGATWNPWDEVWLSSGVLQEFQDDYVVSGQAAVIFIDPFNPTIDDLMGTSNNSAGFNFVEDTNFPVISTNDDIIDDFEIEAFPSIRMICPDGTGYADLNAGTGLFTVNENIFYANLETAEHVAEQMFENCGTVFDLNTIEGKIFHDLNDNCTYENAETGTPGVTATISGPNGTVTRVTNSDGIFRRLASPGTYSVSVTPPNNLWSTCNSPIDITFDNGPTTSEFVEMGLQAEDDCSKLVTTITAPILRRCFDSHLFVTYCNEGTVSANNVELTVELGEYMEYVSSDLAPSSVVGQTITYDLDILDPWECDKIKITFYTDCDVELGTEQCYSSTLSPKELCDDGRLITETECQEIRGAYDPNDKRAFPLSGSDDYVIEPNATIKYQIRFQNTGSDTAFNIFIEDQISEYLDLNTFRVGQASHDYEIEIDENRLMTIRFPNVMLPDSSVNLVGSNGYINYYIGQQEDLTNGTIIENSAGIFFDFNPPVLTNTTSHRIDDGTATQDLHQINFSVFPNPAYDVLDIRIDKEDWASGKAEIVDLTGRVLMNEVLLSNVGQINVGGLDEGIYILALTNERGEKATEVVSVMK